MSFYEDDEEHSEHYDSGDDNLDDDEELEQASKPIKKTQDDINENDDELDDEYELDDDENDDILPDNEEEEDKHYIEDNISFNTNELENESSFELIVSSESRITSNTLTIYEMTELISVRAQQISQGSYVFVPDIEGINDPIEIAKLELLNNKSPLYIKREIGITKNKDSKNQNEYIKKVELWNPNEMNKLKIG